MAVATDQFLTDRQATTSTCFEPNKNVWIEVKRTMQEAWPLLPAKNNDAVFTLQSDG